MSLPKILSMSSLKSIALIGVIALFMAPLAQATPVNFTIGSVTLTNVSCTGQCIHYTTDLPLSTISPLTFSLNVGDSVTLDVLKFTMQDRRLARSFTVTGDLNFDLTSPSGTTAIVLFTAIRYDGTGSFADSVTMTFGADGQSTFGPANDSVLNVHMIDLLAVNPYPDHGVAQGTITYVPESSTVVLLGLGMLGVAFSARRKLSV